MQRIDEVVFFGDSHQNIDLKSATRNVLESSSAVANLWGSSLKNVAEIFGGMFFEKSF